MRYMAGHKLKDAEKNEGDKAASPESGK